MCTSVPHIEATFTRIRTSSGRTDGIGTFLTSVLFGAASDFTAAVIVSAKCPDLDLGDAGFTSIYQWGKFCRSIPDDYEEVFLLPELLVENLVSRVHAQDRCGRELARGSDDDHVARPDPTKDLRAHLEVAAPEDEPLRPDRAQHELCPWMLREKAQDSLLIQVRRDSPSAEDRVDP